MILPTAANIVVTAASGSSVTYSFAGWLSDGRIVGDISDTDFGNKVLTANITSNPIYSVTYSHNYDGGPTVMRNVENNGVAPNLSPTRIGHTFDKWYTEAECINAYDFDTEKVTGAITLYAGWTINSYKVTFNANGGVNIGAEMQTVDHGASASRPADPVRTGYVFEGWFTDLALPSPYSFDSAVEDNIKLYAKWSVGEYDVIFDADNGSEVVTVKVAFGSRITAPSAPTKTGHTFGGWYNGNAAWNFDETMPAESLTLKAKWIANEYTITFVTGDKAQAIPSVTYTYGIGRDLPGASDVNVLQKGYSFLGWYEDGSFAGEKYASVSAEAYGDLIFYARIERNSTVDFVFNLNYEGAQNITDNVVQGTPAVERSVTRAGYTFLGWFTAAAGGVKFDFANDIMSTTTVYAHWEPFTYTVTFDAQNGSAPTEREYTSEQTVTAIAQPSKTGHTFGGWFKDADCSAGNEYVFGNLASENVVLYAKWIVNIYTVGFNVNGGTGSMSGITVEYLNGGDGEIQTQTVTYGGKASRPLGITKEGYDLLGWKKNGQALWDFDENGITENITLVAEWKIKTYTVTFDSNGGSAVAAQTVEHGGAVEEPDVPVRTGWTFVGWKLDGAVYDFTATVTGNIELVAEWSGAEGTYLYYTTDGVNWTTGAPAAKNGTKNEYVIEGIRLYKGMQLLVVTKKESGDVWLHAASAISQGEFGSVVKVTSVAATGGYNFVITELDARNVGAEWDIFIYGLSNGATVGADGSLSKECTANGISFRLAYDNAMRDPAGEDNAITEAETATADVYLRGNFTDGFKLSDEWSSDSALVKVLKKGDVYTFRKVYLKKGDAFKVYISGMTEGSDATAVDKGWFGGMFGGLDAVTELSNEGSALDIYLGSIENGYYDIIVDKANGTLTVKTYAPPTVATVTVTPPAKTEYWLGEPYDGSGLVVSATDTDGETVVTDSYDISGNSTDTVGNITVTVTYGGKSDTFTITVSAITVTFDSDGGTAVAALSLRYGDNADRPTDPIKVGYDLVGWYEEGQSAEYAFGEPVYRSVALKAKWTLHRYTVTFKNGNDIVGTVQVPHNTAIAQEQIPVAPDKLGYDFAYWKSGVAQFDFDTAITADTVLYAEYTLQSYTVTLVFDDGVTQPATQTVNYGGRVVKPSDASTDRRGYEFLGWFKTGQTTAYDFDATVSEAFTLTAKWDVIDYTVTYIVGENGVAVPNGTYTVEDAVTLPVPTVTAAGYSFAGWYDNAEFNGNQIVTIAKGSIGNLTFYANITQNATVALIFDYNYTGSPVPTETQVVAGTSGSPLNPEPTRRGHTFGGWYIDADCTTAYAFGVMTEPVTVYAKWDINSYTVEFNTIGGSAVASVTVQYGGKITEPAEPTRKGYTFGGWYKENTYITAWDFENDVVENDTMLYAGWTVNKYTVTFDSDGGSLVAALTNVPYNSIIDKPGAPTKAGYSFEGWYVGATEWNFETDKVTDNIILTAKRDIISFGLTYTLYGGVNGNNPDSYKVTDGTVTLADATCEGYDFKGWYTSANGGGDKVEELTIDLFAGGNGLALHAYFTVKSFTVTFNVNFDDGENFTATAEYNTVVAKPVDPVREGYDFVDWYKDADCTVGNEWDFAVDKVTAEVELFAGWNLSAVAFLNDGTSLYAMKDNTENIDHTVDEDGNPKNPTHQTEYMIKGVALTAGVTVSFSVNDDVAVEMWIERKANVGITGANTRATSFKTTLDGEFDFYLQYYTDGGAAGKGGWRVWVEGPTPEIVIPEGAVEVEGGNMYLVGKFGDSTVTDDYGFIMPLSSGSTTQYEIKKTLAVGDMVAAYRKDWNFRCVAIENAADMSDKLAAITVGTKEYLEVKKAGEYTFYLKNEYGNDRFYIGYKSSETPDPVEQEIVPSANSIVLKCKDGTVKISVKDSNGYLYGVSNVKLTSVFLHVYGDGSYTGAWKAGTLNQTFDASTLSVSGIKNIIIGYNNGSSQTASITVSAIDRSHITVSAENNGTLVSTATLSDAG